MKKPSKRRVIAAAGIAAACAGLVGTGLAVTGGTSATAASSSADNQTTTPIKHVVVLFGENISFDHYFGTYPLATNTDGTPFTGKKPITSDGKPLNNYTGGSLDQTALTDSPLLSQNANSTGPYRLTPSRALTASQNHNYIPEQQAEDGDATTGAAKMDKFPQYTASAASTSCASIEYCGASLNMGYYDGNTVTAMWNYAQNFAMSENSWDDDFGPSTDGALNLVSGQTYGAVNFDGSTAGEDPTPLVNSTDATKAYPDSSAVAGNHLATVQLPGYPTAADPNPAPTSAKVSVGTVVGDPDPIYDDCSYGGEGETGQDQAGMLGQNIGDVLNSKNISWGWFQGGFASTSQWDGKQTDRVTCTSKHDNIGGLPEPDYSEHHDPFQYYASTANPHHLPGTPGVTTGTTDLQHEVNGQWYGANHQYDGSVLDEAINNQDGQTLPAVSFVKAAEYQDGHPGNSDPIDEQHFYTHVINELEKSKYWSSTAIIINYDDSDGWYDHQAPTILTGSDLPANGGFTDNATTGAKGDQPVCTVPFSKGSATPPTNTGSDDTGDVEQGRCGPSQRIPFLVISPYAKSDYVDNSSTPLGQASIDKFIEQNWSLAPAGKSAIDDAAVTGSFDTRDGSIDNMFDFSKPQSGTLILNPNGSVQSDTLGGLAPAKAKLTKDQKSLSAAKAKLAKDNKAVKKAKGAKKAAAKKAAAAQKKKVAALTKVVATDKKDVAALS